MEQIPRSKINIIGVVTPIVSHLIKFFGKLVIGNFNNMPTNLKKETSVFLNSMLLITLMSVSNSLFAQDSNDPYYHDRETEGVDGQVQSESRTFFTEENSEEMEEHHYYTESIEEDDESPSMLTFNFLFYMAYKLKFSDSIDDEADDSLVSDD